jgi:methylenetetrahydrofolate dehydrogenase (NADP+)/methenyltetrahydrofolate cyclohydrolase
MNHKIIDCNIIANQFLEQLQITYKQLKEKYKIEVLNLAIIQIGDDYASSIYIKNKIKYCYDFGINVKHIKLENNTQEEYMINLIQDLNQNIYIHGILLQLPIAKEINLNKILNFIDAKKDVDGFNIINLGNIFLGNNTLAPCTTKGILYILEHLKIKIEGLNVVILGRSNIVGKPLAIQLINLGATVSICNSKTNNLKYYTKNADILIVAIGQNKFINSNFIKQDAIIIDVGINRSEDNKICGDVDMLDVIGKVKYITPVPNGVGKMTVSMLIANLIECYLKQI